MTTSTRTRVAALVATAGLTAGLSAGLSAPAQAKGDDDRVERTGSCSQGARWKLKVKTDDGRLEVEGEVDSNQSGQAWAWRIKHDGGVSARGTARTTGRSGSFSVERRVTDLPGTHRIAFVARHRGQTCRGVINF